MHGADALTQKRRIPLLGRAVPVPIPTINFEDGTRLRQVEVDDVAPESSLPLELNTSPFQYRGHDLLGLGSSAGRR
jgi:hypothetical protein